MTGRYTDNTYQDKTEPVFIGDIFGPVYERDSALSVITTNSPE